MNRITRRTFLGGATTLGLGLAGCGGAQKQSETSSADNGSVTKITFCLDYTPNTNHTGVYVAQEKGYFTEEGLESYQDYLANAFDGGNTNIQAVAAVIQHNTSGIMSRDGDGITRPAAMEGHRYATWELPVEQATIRQIVEKDGGDFTKVEEKMVPYTVDDEVMGLKTNLFDCVWVFEGWAVQNANVQNYAVDYFSFISIDEVFDFYTPVIAANTTYASAHPDVIKAFLRAVKKGYEFAIAQPQDAADILCEQAPELDAKLVAQSQAYLAEQYQADAPSWGLIDKDRWARFFQWLNDKGLVRNKLDVDSGWTMEYLA